MNAALRAVVQTGLNYGVETLGVQCGYKGLLEANFTPLSARDVGGIIRQGELFSEVAAVTSWKLRMELHLSATDADL
jgi:6-phosphofructokinase 1